jgi:hypothetical protein
MNNSPQQDEFMPLPLQLLIDQLVETEKVDAVGLGG